MPSLLGCRCKWRVQAGAPNVQEVCDRVRHLHRRHPLYQRLQGALRFVYMRVAMLVHFLCGAALYFVCKRLAWGPHGANARFGTV